MQDKCSFQFNGNTHFVDPLAFMCSCAPGYLFRGSDSFDSQTQTTWQRSIDSRTATAEPAKTLTDLVTVGNAVKQNCYPTSFSYIAQSMYSYKHPTTSNL
jgi:hypothetical protein